MGDFRVRPRIFHEENFVVPSSTQKIPQCTKEVLEKSKSSNTIKFETIFGKINQIIAKTKSGKWHTFQQEQKLNEKRARNCHFFFTENDGKITFHKGSTSPPKNPVNWTGLLPLGILGLAKLISGAEAVQLNYTTTDPVLMNTPNGEGQFRSCDLALRPDTMGVVWDNNNEISQSWMPYDGSPSTEAPVTTKVGIKEGEVRAVPYKDKTYYFWIHTDANGRSVTYIRVDSNYQVIEEEKSIPMPNNPRHYDCMISLQNGTFHGYLVNRTGHQKWEAYKFQINPETGNRVGSFDKVQEYGTFQQKPTGLFFEDESIATFLTIDGGLYREYQGNFTQICPPPAYPLKYQYAKPCLIPNGYVVGCAIVDTQSLNQIIGYKILRFNPDGSPMDPYEISLASAADMGTTNMFGSTLEILGNARGATVIYRDNGQLKQVTLNETGIPQGEPKPFGTGSNIIAFSAKQSFNTNSTNDDIYSCFTTPTGVSIQRSQTYVPPLPTPAPTPSPSPSPTPFPTQSPTPSPSPSPTPQPTPLPTSSPTPFPTQFPTPSPSPSPTPQPTPLPTSSPTPLPTQSPTPSPTPEPPDPVGPIPDPDSQESIYQKPLFLIPLIAAASLCYCICYCAFCILNRRRKKQKVEAYVDNLAKRDPPLDGSLEYYQASETKDSQRVQLFKFPEPSAPQEEKTKTKKTKSFVEIDVNEEEQPPSRSPPSPPREEKKKSEPNWWKEKKASFGEGMPPKQTPVYTTKSLDEIVVEEKEEEKIPKFVKNIGNWGSFYSEKSLSESEKSWSKSEKSWSKSEEFNELKKDLKKEKRPASDSSDDEMLHRAISKENQLSFSELDDTGSLSTLKKKILDTAPSIATLELFFETQPEEFFTAFQILRDQGYDEKNLPSDPALKEISLKIKQLKKIASSRTDRPSFVDIQKRFSEIATLKRGLSEESRQSFSDVDTLINKIETFERTLQPTESYGDVFDPNRQESEFPTPQESKEELIEDEPEKQKPVDTHHESKLTRRTPSTLGYPSDEEQNGESRFDVETNREGSITTAVLVVKGKSKKTRGK